MKITTQLLENVMKKDGRYHVPENIKKAIERSLEHDHEDEITDEYRRLFKLFQSYEKINEPIPVSYNGAVTLDAYTAYYLCRNVFIPSIALRDLAFNPRFQDIPSHLQVLDLGCGTGAVTLGLLSVFGRNPLSESSLRITAVDYCTEALDRQSKIIAEAGFDLSRVEHRTADINNTDDCLGVLKESSPYHLIFIANCLTEIRPEIALALVERLPEVLADDGAIIIAEAQRNYTKKLIRTLIGRAGSQGLAVYYPCPAGGCPSSYGVYCWVWRYHGYEVPDIRVRDQQLQDTPKDELVAIWLILTKQSASIYDLLRDSRSDLSWGPISRETGRQRSICCGKRDLSFEDKSFFPRYRRGHIVGLSEKSEVIEHYRI